MSRFRPSRNYISGEFVITGGPVDITGDLVVSGSVTANQYNVNVINTNVTHIDADGDTKFGDSADDTHQFTGSVFINGPLSASSIIGGATTPGAPLTSVQYNDAGSFAGDANFTWNDTTSALTVTGDITASANVSGAFFYGDGSGLTGVTATSAPAGSNTEIQFNADGVTAADADLVWLTGSNTLNVNGYISSSALFVSSSNSAETLLRVDSHNKPYLFTVDSSASFDGKARVMIRNSNDDTAPAFNTSNRGLLHLEQLQTTTVNEAQGITVWSDTTGTIASQLRLVTFSPPAGLGSEVLFGTSNGHIDNPFVSDNQALGRLAYGGFDGNGFYYGALIYARATEAWNFSVQNGTELQFFLVPTGKGSSTNLAERIRFTSEGHLIVFPYSASNNDAIGIETSYDKSAGAPALQVYGPTLFGSSSLNTHTFTGSVKISGDLSASLNVSASAFYGDGSNLTGLARDFGPSATDPVGSPNAGDFYYNTVLNMTMHYDSSRTKWLSAETSEIHFGRNGNTGTGAYYRGINGRSYSAIQGRYAEHNGTIVSFSYTRGDTDAAVFNVTSGGTTVSFLSSSAIGGSTETLSDDFAADTVLGVRNQSADGNTTTDVLGVVRMKWRI